MAADLYNWNPRPGHTPVHTHSGVVSPPDRDTLHSQRVPSSTISAHVRALLEVGHTSKSLAARMPSPVNSSFAYDIAHERTKTVDRAIADALLNIPADPSTAPPRPDRDRLPAEPVTAHLQRLRSAGMTVQQIRDASGVALSVISDLSRGRASTVAPAHAERLMSVTLTVSPTQPVNAAPARQHVLALLDSGASHASIAEASGVPLSTIGHLAVGNLKRIHRKSADALLAVQPVHAQTDTATVPAAPTQARIHELLDAGYTLDTLAAAAGITREALSLIARGRRETVRASTETAIAAVPMTDIPDANDGKTSAAKARAHILHLYENGAIDRTIADAAGVSPSIIQKVRTGTQTVLFRHTEEWILAVTPEMATAPRCVKADEVREHIRLLREQGVFASQIGRAAGLAGTTIRDISRGRIKNCTPDTVARILAVTVEDALTNDDTWADLTAIRNHVQALLDSQVTVHQIARAAKISDMAVHHIMDGTTTKVTSATGDAILAIEFPEPAFVSAVGPRRRVQALVANGWSIQRIERECGRNVWELVSPLHTPQNITADKAVAIAEFFATNEHVPGGRTQARNLAVRNGWLAAGWWDSDNIDDPDYYPAGVPAEIVAARRAVVKRLRQAEKTVGDVVWTLGLPPEIAQRDFTSCFTEDELLEQLVRLRTAGMSIPASARVMSISETTALRYARLARERGATI